MSDLDSRGSLNVSMSDLVGAVSEVFHNCWRRRLSRAGGDGRGRQHKIFVQNLRSSHKILWKLGSGGARSEVFSQLPETDCPGPEETEEGAPEPLRTFAVAPRQVPFMRQLIENWGTEKVTKKQHHCSAGKGDSRISGLSFLWCGSFNLHCSLIARLLTRCKKMEKGKVF